MVALFIDWIPSIPSFIPTPITLLPNQKLVSELIVPVTKQWNQALFHNLFDHKIAPSIQQINIPFTPIANSIIWAKCPSGNFFVKLLTLFTKMPDTQILVPLPLLNGRNYWFNERHKYYIWKIAWDVLHTREFLARRIVGLDSFCP